MRCHGQPRAAQPVRLRLTSTPPASPLRASRSSRRQVRALPSEAEEGEEDPAALVAESQRILNTLLVRRGMKTNEVKLVLLIEDPREARRRAEYGVEDASGVSRAEVAQALTEVAAGLVPADTLALRQLAAELRTWPYLESDEALRGDAGEPSPYAAITPGTPVQRRAAPADELEVPAEKDLSDFLPKWFGYSAVYLVSAIPVFITLSVLALLFITSLK